MKVVEEFLEKHNSLTIAYVQDGKPRSCALWYVFSLKNQPILFFLSSTKTNHGKQLQHDPNVSFTIHKDDQIWSEITGIQGTGICSIVEENKDEIMNMYSNRFPIIKRDDLKDQVDKSELWQIHVTWIRLIDNSVSFGHKREYEF